MRHSAWQYYNPVRIFAECGAVQGLDAHVPYERVALITSPGFSRRGTVKIIAQALGGRLVSVLDSVQPNPDVRVLDRQAEPLRTVQPDALIALGGGSSIDTAKALARLLTQQADSTLTEHFRQGKKFTSSKALPVIAIPTTAGTGAEVTPFGTVWDFELNKKYSVTGKDLYPEIAILDPELTLGLPEEVTVSSGLDAISHALESVWNKNASPITLALAAQALRLAIPALRLLKMQPDHILARSDLMQASLIAGLAISQTRTALAHAISYPLTTHFNLPHGVACSFTLPALLEFNAKRDDGRLRGLAYSLEHSSVQDLANDIRKLLFQVNLEKIFARFLIDRAKVLEVSREMQAKDRAENNLREAGPGDIQEILNQSLSYLGLL